MSNLTSPGSAQTKRKHGHRAGKRSPTYNSWRAMIERCCYEPHPYYPDYGGRGIRVFNGWRGPGGFARFLADAGERPPGRTLDRIDVNGDYEPGNVRWATPLEQRWNRRDMAERRSQGSFSELEPQITPNPGSYSPATPPPAAGMPF